MTDTGLRIEQRSGVLWMILDRPRVNALNAPLEQALIAAIGAAARDASVRSAVLSSANERVFSAGADLKEVLDPDPARARRLRADLLLETILALATYPKPMVAAVAGKAVGAGCMLPLLADEVICGPGAELSLPEIQHDMPTPLGAAVIAARAPHVLVQKLVQAGEPLGAEAALQAGLAKALVSPGHLAEAAQARAEQLGALPARSYGGNKAWINAPLIRSLRDAAAHAASLREASHAS